MAWTYTSDPSNVPRDAVRLLVGDTITTDPQLQDEEIAYFLSQAGGSVTGAAVRCARALMAKFARLVDKSVGDLRLSYSQRQAAYAALLADLETQLALGAVPFAGGTSISDINTRRGDTDRPAPDFERDMDSDREGGRRHPATDHKFWDSWP